MSDTRDIVERLRQRAHNGIAPMHELARLDMLEAAAEITRLRAALAQAGAGREPVAWQLPGSDSIIPATLKAWRGALAEQWTIPLFAHPSPAQREPLSDARDRPDQRSSYVAGYGYIDTSALRAIERAHGIATPAPKEQQ